MDADSGATQLISEPDQSGSIHLICYFRGSVLNLDIVIWSAGGGFVI